MSDFKVREDWMAFCLPDVTDAEVASIADAVRSGWWAKGPRTIAFEKQFAEYVGAKYCIGLNSCTAALHLSLAAKNIGPGDEVITTPLTFAASANTILHVGATPVFADIDPDTGLIDPKEIEKKITKKTKAIVPVHYSGLAADLGEIGRLCDSYNLFLSEDAAHAVETRYNGELIGHNPRGAVSYSFYATKNLACGEGGALITDDEELANKARVLSCHGMSAGAWNRYGKGGSWRYDIEEPGYKYNMFDLQAALASVQLERMDDMQRRRFACVDVYEKAFKDVPQLRLLKTPAAHRARGTDDFPRSVHRGAQGAQCWRERAFHCAAYHERVYQALWLQAGGFQEGIRFLRERDLPAAVFHAGRGQGRVCRSGCAGYLRKVQAMKRSLHDVSVQGFFLWIFGALSSIMKMINCNRGAWQWIPQRSR